MAINSLHNFLERYFTAHDCPILKNNQDMLTIQLTEKMDRLLMNRPFYWHYIKQIGQTGEPKQLSLVTNPEKQSEEGEWIHYGSPRLQQIYADLHQRERYTKLFQKLDVKQKTPLYPWLVINLKISYIGKQKKDEVQSIGLQLINGGMVFAIMDQLRDVTWHKTISDYCFTISPLIKLQSGFKRIESVLMKHIHNQDNGWAQETLNTRNEELAMLTHFYQNRSGDVDEKMEAERQQIENRYQPKISCEVINGGLFYMADGVIT